MGANDKTQATFHGAERGSAYESGILSARLHELNQADEIIAGEGSEDFKIEPAELVIGERGLETLDNGIAGIPDSLMLNAGLEVLIQQSGQNSKDHGFHEDFPEIDSTDPKTLGLHLTQKLMLMAEELIESFGEIRDGRSPYQTYFVDKKGVMGEKGKEYAQQWYGEPDQDGGYWEAHEEPQPGDIPLLKPEGFLVEIADLFIRGGDLIFLLKCPEEFLHALNIKHEYNKTRPFKHGRQF